MIAVIKRMGLVVTCLALLVLPLTTAGVYFPRDSDADDISMFPPKLSTADRFLDLSSNVESRSRPKTPEISFSDENLQIKRQNSVGCRGCSSFDVHLCEIGCILNSGPGSSGPDSQCLDECAETFIRCVGCLNKTS
ncbi:hypothetical protein DPMN_039529 [Dreissena polymorpha]|uniref:Uncharacterized protein n=1 Tax=Dreissena polymorpha TaxID=45954 RepID=A0A9D4HUC4_DREPO|nr:hypothetical protein DPMN_039529 [Dreissena polymorpha]